MIFLLFYFSFFKEPNVVALILYGLNMFNFVFFSTEWLVTFSNIRRHNSITVLQGLSFCFFWNCVSDDDLDPSFFRVLKFTSKENLNNYICTADIWQRKQDLAATGLNLSKHRCTFSLVDRH